MRRLGISVLLAFALVWALPISRADADGVATLESSPTTYEDGSYVLDYTANDGKPNNLTATDSPEKFTITDPGVAIVARTLDQRNPCFAQVGSAECAHADRLIISTHGASDSINVSGPDLTYVRITAGRGNDKITVSAPLASVNIYCGPGFDRLTILAARSVYIAGGCDKIS
jgi:hypothetical protein